MNDTGLIELSGKGMPLFSRPFLFTANQPLKALDGEPVIQVRDGVQFINSDLFKPGGDIEKNLDSDFKDLVDSVLLHHA
ncbi:hypothetical protein FACS1894140_2590 [Spirochaetia bacterium]|nr:hypothetical protein FACS1894140_2590 [Spirochaetia bacterium]